MCFAAINRAPFQTAVRTVQHSSGTGLYVACRCVQAHSVFFKIVPLKPDTALLCPDFLQNNLPPPGLPPKKVPMCTLRLFVRGIKIYSRGIQLKSENSGLNLSGIAVLVLHCNAFGCPDSGF